MGDETRFSSSKITRRLRCRLWEIEDNGACFIVRDHSGQALGHHYYENEPGRRAAAILLTRDEMRRIALNVARAITGCKDSAA
jgi:hypothetical protein